MSTTTSTSTTSLKGRILLILLGILIGALLVGLGYGVAKLTTTPPSPIELATPPVAMVVPTAAPAPPSAKPEAACPKEAQFAELTGVIADKVGEEPCAFHWRGDPLVITPINACPEGWSCQLGVSGQGNILYYGGSPNVTIYAATWRLVAAYPENDPVHNPCAFLLKSQQEGSNAVPRWTINPGNFSCR